MLTVRGGRSQSAQFWGSAAVACVFLGVALWLGAALNIWVDEAYTLRTTAGGLLHSARVWTVERQAPLYFVVLSAWRFLGESILVARVFSALSVAGFLLMLHLLSRRYFPSEPSPWIVLAAAANPYAIWAATEIRVSGLALLLSGAVLLVADLESTPMNRGVSALLEGSGKRAFSILRLAVIGVLWAVALYTHYYMGFLIAGICVAIGLSRPTKALGLIAISGGVSAVLLVPLVSAILRQVGELASGLDRLSLKESVKVMYGIGRNYLLSAQWYIKFPGKKWVGYGLVAGAVVWVLTHWRAVRPRHVGLWVVFAVVNLSYLVVGMILGRSSVENRHAFVLFPLWLLFVYSLVDLSSRAAQKRVLWVVVTAALIAAGIPEALVRWGRLAKPGDYRRVAEFIEKNEHPGQPIVVFNSEGVLPLMHYYSGLNRTVPMPTHPGEEWIVYQDFVVGDVDAVRERFRIVGDPGTIWFFDNLTDGYAGVRYNREHLDAYLDECYVAVLQREFFHARLSLLIRKELCPSTTNGLSPTQ